jgi:hypothetical protein
MPAAVLDGQTTALPGPFAAAPDPRGVVPTPATRALVASQVSALLAATPAFHQLPSVQQRELNRHMEHIACYAAELVRDDWYQSAQLDQRPVLRRQATLTPVARAQAAGDNLGAGATSRVGSVTRQTLKAIAFPEFVADLIRSTFRAIMDANIQQLDAIRALLGNVSGTVDEFEESNITDSQAREWLAMQYGSHLQLSRGKLTAREDAPETPPNWQDKLGLPGDVDLSDSDAIEDKLVPAARRKLSQGRLETLSLLVLMGMDRIVVTGGKIRATMAFHIDASDAAREANASQFDLRVAAAASVGFGPWSASVSTSVGYVTSSRSESESEINVAADLTGEVELHFRSDPVQISRMLNQSGIDTIVANTPVPAANAEAIPWGTSPDARAAIAPKRQSARIDRPLVEPPAVTASPVGDAKPAAKPDAAKPSTPPAQQKPAAANTPPAQQKPTPTPAKPPNPAPATGKALATRI